MTGRMRRFRRFRRILRVPRVIADRSDPLHGLEDGEIREKYRFGMGTITMLVDMLSHEIKSATERSHAIPPYLQVLVALRFLATGCFQSVVGDLTSRLSQPTCSRIIHRVCNALMAIAHRYISFPRFEEARRVKQGFFRIAGFPGVLGAVDGSLIKIQAPRNNEGPFVCRKGFHALNVQVVCNHELKITSIVANWPGSVHDARIFRQSELAHTFERGDHDGHLVADSSYSLQPFCLTPYAVPIRECEKRYNASLVKTRCLVEQALGVLKRRFPCLHGELRYEPERCVPIIIATVVLHNIARDQVNADVPEYAVEDNEIGNHVVEDIPHAARQIRDAFAQRHFS